MRPAKRGSSKIRICVAAGLALLSGCTVGPDYKRPAPLPHAQLPAAFEGAGPVDTNTPEWKIATPAAHIPRGRWWEIFQDPELNRLEDLANGANQELAAAVARLEQSRGLLIVARSGYFPDVTADARYTRQRTSENQPLNGHAAGASETYDNFVASLGASWELDLWGRVRREVEAGKARLTASADDLESLKLQIQAELANDFFELRAAEAETEVLRRSIDAYRQSLDLTQNRRRGGIASDLEVSQAESQLRTTEAQLPAVELRRKRLQNVVAVLCAQPASGFTVSRQDTNSASVPFVPASVPSELLERRPDVAAAERRMAAANADIGVAKAAFYPAIRLNGLAGLQSVDAGTLFNWPSRMWAVGPSLEWPIFTGRRNRARLAIAGAQYDEAVADYRQRVLVAFQEVEDQLAAQRLLADQLGAEERALTAARRMLEIANNRYRAGLVTFLEVAVAQSSELVRERELVLLQAERRAAAVALIRALGGPF